MFGVLERLFVVEHTRTRLVLREYPLMAWLIAGALLIGAGNLLVLGLDVTALASVIGAGVIVAFARIRRLSWDTTTGMFHVEYLSVLRPQVARKMLLSALEAAEVYAADSGHTQLVLETSGEPLGLSVYSRDIKDWKTPLADAINRLLEHAQAA